MSLYFFHLSTPAEYVVDDTGVELENADEAFLEAYHGAREISFDLLRSGQSARRYRFDVFDSQGRFVHAVPFSEAMGQTVANKPASGFVAGASRGYELASELAREIAVARQNLRKCRELLAFSPVGAKPV